MSDIRNITTGWVISAMICKLAYISNVTVMVTRFGIGVLRTHIYAVCRGKGADPNAGSPIYMMLHMYNNRPSIYGISVYMEYMQLVYSIRDLT